MTPRDDHHDEMPPNATLDERSIDAILAGTAPAHQAPLLAFVADLRAITDAPAPAPSPALAQLFATGVSTDIRDPASAAGRDVAGPASQVAGRPTWRKFVIAVQKFIAGLSIAGKVALGAGVAAAATTGAGTAGVLPDPVQHQFARAVEPIAPFEVHDPKPPSSLAPPEAHDATGPVAARQESPTTTRPAEPEHPTTTKAPEPEHPSTTVAPPAPAVRPEGPAAPAPTEVPEREHPATTQAPEPEHPSTTKAREPEHPSTTKAPEAPTPVTFTLTCGQNPAALSVTCSWVVLSPTNADRYLLLRVGPDGNRTVGEFHDLATASFVDVHVTAGAQYQYLLVARAPGSVANVGRSGQVPVAVVAR